MLHNLYIFRSTIFSVAFYIFIKAIESLLNNSILVYRNSKDRL